MIVPSVESTISAFASVRAPVRDARTSSKNADLAADKDFSSLLDDTAPRDDAPADRPQSRRTDSRSRRDAAVSDPGPRRPADTTDMPVKPDGTAGEPVAAADPMGEAEPGTKMAAAPSPPAKESPTTDGDTAAIDTDTPANDSVTAGADGVTVIDTTIVPMAPQPVPVAPPSVATASLDIPADGDGSIEIAPVSPAATASAAAADDAKAPTMTAPAAAAGDTETAQPNPGKPTEGDAPTDLASAPQAQTANPIAKPAARMSKDNSEPVVSQPLQGEAPTDTQGQPDAENPTTSALDATPSQYVKTSATGPADEQTTAVSHSPAAATHHANLHTGLEALQPVPANQQSAALAAASASTTQQAAATVPVSGIAVEIATRAQAGNNRFEIRLDPPELGRIDVRLDVDRHGNVTSHLVVERSETLDLLRRDAPNLERALQDAGLKTGDSALQFSLRDQGARGDRDARDTSLPDLPDVVAPTNEPEPIVQAVRSYRWSGATSGIDIRV